MIDITKIKEGDIFSEESHYVVKRVSDVGILFTHLESGRDVQIGLPYVKDLLHYGDHFTKVVEVTKEDSKDGSKLGIRSIFENLKSSEVFTVVFTKQSKDKSASTFKKELEEQRIEAVKIIEKARANKKSMVRAYTEALAYVQENPIRKDIPGEDRTLRGYKIQFKSRDGRYNCVDIDLLLKRESHIRQVNINTIKELIVGGTKYVVK